MGNNLLVYVLCVASFAAHAQTSGSSSYTFLDVPGNARLAALGGVNVSLADRDVNFFFSNPALVGDSLAGWGSAGYRFFAGDMGQTSIAYSANFDRIGALQFGVQHMDYGTFEGYDPSGMELGEFSARETALVVSRSHAISHYRLGVTMKGVFSSFAGFRSSALLFDIGGVFIHPDKDLSVGIVIRNAGFVLSEYSESSMTSPPFDVQMGVTFKPEHMPIRFSVTVHDLADVDDGYYDPLDEDVSALNKVLRHVNFGAEVLLHRNVSLLAGYNVRLHRELRMEEYGGGAGVTLGFSARVKTFEFTFGRSGYIAGVASYNLTLAADINGMLKRRTIL
ncbi:MAG: type IX secretion system protein PorQ [Bacteroidota bacterium]|nr:MAG: hypothetical protein DIU61_00850 [Bacteroidota bacterium]